MRTCVQEEVFWPWKSNYSRSFPWGVITCPCRTHGLGRQGLLNRLPPFRYFPDISPLSNTSYLVHVVNITFIFENCRRISCDDTSQIWKWYLSLIFFQRVVQIINKDQIQHQTSIYYIAGLLYSEFIHPRTEQSGKSIHDDVIKWTHVPRSWPFVKGIHRSQVNSTGSKASDAELWYFRWSAPELRVVQTIETPVIWDAIALIMTSL